MHTAKIIFVVSDPEWTATTASVFSMLGVAVHTNYCLVDMSWLSKGRGVPANYPSHSRTLNGCALDLTAGHAKVSNSVKGLG